MGGEGRAGSAPVGGEPTGADHGEATGHGPAASSGPDAVWAALVTAELADHDAGAASLTPPGWEEHPGHHGPPNSDDPFDADPFGDDPFGDEAFGWAEHPAGAEPTDDDGPAGDLPGWDHAGWAGMAPVPAWPRCWTRFRSMR